MSAAPPAMEFQFSAEGSEIRQKIDFKFSSEHSACDLRNSLAWDSAFFTSPGILDIDELFETLNLRAAMDHTKDKKPPPSSSVSAAASASHYDTRQSLAWDSAFFTSAGVLDAEELSMVNKGFRSSVAKSEPETWRSVESNSTANSDGSSLASLEIDLFTDIKGAPNQHLLAPSFDRRMVTQEGNGGSSSGKPPRMMSSRGGSSTLSTQTKKASTLRGKTSAVKSTPPLKSPSSVLPAATGNGSYEQVTRTPPRSSRRTVEPRMAASVPTSRTPLKFLGGSKNGSLGSSASSFSSTPKVSPASSISELSSSSGQSSRLTNQRHHVSPVKPCFASASPRRSSTASRTMKRFAGGGSATPKKLQASGLKMPSPKLGYFDSDNPSGSVARRGNLKSNSHEQTKTAMATSSSSRTTLGKHHLSEIVGLSLDSKIGNSNERWEESLSNNNNTKKKKKRCLKEDGARQGKGSSCSCNKRPGSNKENSIGVAASLDSQVDELSRHLKAIHFHKGFSPVWK